MLQRTRDGHLQKYVFHSENYISANVVNLLQLKLLDLHNLFSEPIATTHSSGNF